MRVWQEVGSRECEGMAEARGGSRGSKPTKQWIEERNSRHRVDKLKDCSSSRQPGTW